MLEWQDLISNPNMEAAFLDVFQMQKLTAGPMGPVRTVVVGTDPIFLLGLEKMEKIL